jgi:hypothetical protein
MTVSMKKEETKTSSGLRAAQLLTALIIPLVLVASAGGLFLEGLYRDTLWASSQFRGSDLVRLVVVVPIFAAAFVMSMRGSKRALLVWLGMLWLTLYDYAFYLFGAAFNEFFLVYVTLFSLSILALIFGVASIDAGVISRQFRARTPVKWIAGYMVFIAAFLGGFWTAQTVSFLVTGQLPQTIIDSGIHTSIVFALDLSLLVPGMVLGAIWLWQRRPWGYALAALMMIKGTLYPMVLIGMAIFYARATGTWDALTLFWVFFAVASVIFAGLLFGNMKSAKEQDERSHSQGVPGPEARLSPGL